MKKRTTSLAAKHLLAPLLVLAMLFSIAACGGAPQPSQAPAVTPSETPAGAYTDGTYTSSANGNNGPIKVTVTVAGGKITVINIDEHAETAGLSEPALEQIPKAIIDAQTTEVDSVAGATMTSKGIMEAVANALSGKGDEEPTAAEITIVPDVIVVGAGMAGLTAATRACQLGAKVLLLEQNYRVGGSANTAGGSISGTGFAAQKAAGIEDSPEKFYNDFITMGGGEQNLNPAIAKVHAERSGPAIDWLKDDVGVEMSDQVDSGGYLTMNTDRVTYSAGGAPSGGGSYFVNALSAKLDGYAAQGLVQVMVDTMVTDVLLDADKNIVGVKIGDKEVNAPSVIIATGGYGYSEKWLKEFNFTNITSNDPNTAIGSGYDFARAAGSAFDNMDYSSCYGGSVPVSGFQASLKCNINYNGAVWINTAGERVFNEPTATSMDKRTVWRTTDQNIVYVVLSESMIRDDKPLFSGMMSNSAPFTNQEKIDELLSGGKYMFKADTLEELAQKIGAAKLPDTIAQYNTDVAAGKDSVFGRTDNLVAFDKGPYYAVYTVPYLMMTAGGPRINDQAQMVREDGSVVNGAYLAGEIIGSANIAGHNTIGGIGHGLCATWGKYSAEQAVANAGIEVK